MKVEMKEQKHLWIVFGDQATRNQAEVIIDLEHNDVRICDYRSQVVKVRLKPDLQVKDILVNDVFQAVEQPSTLLLHCVVADCRRRVTRSIRSHKNGYTQENFTKSYVAMFEVYIGGFRYEKKTEKT